VSGRKTSTSVAAARRAESNGDDNQLAEVLKAAESCFRRFGIQRSRMDDVAQAVGIPRPYLYRYVASKEELAVRVTQTLTGRLDEARRKRFPLEGPVGSILAGSFAMGVEWQRDDPFIEDITNLESGKVIASFVWETGAKMPDPDYWFPMFEYGRSRGELRDDLTNEQMLRWLGALAYLLIQRKELYVGEELRFCAEQLIFPALLNDAGRLALQSATCESAQKPKSPAAKKRSSS
jgi:AcrR family transcriptional regulator